MPKPGEHKTVQARILEYSQDIGWTFVPRAEAERRRGFNADAANPSAVWHAVVFVGMLERRAMPTRGLGRVTARHP